MLSDCLSHSTHIWNHFVGWAKGYVVNDKAFAENVFGIDAKSKTLEMRQRNDKWKRLDALTALPPPPVEDVAKL